MTRRRSASSGPRPTRPLRTATAAAARRAGTTSPVPSSLVAASLAKGFGVPLAVLSGATGLVGRFEAESQTRVHCSPPSAAVLRAAEHALALNRRCGDGRRLRLAGLVRHFRSRLAELGMAVSGGLFPVQTLAPAPALRASTLHERLLARGIRTVLHQPWATCEPRISFLITAGHALADIDDALDALSAELTAVPVARRQLPGGISCPR